MTTLELRNSLNALLTNALGTYTLPNGSTTKAIRVRSEGEALPTGTKVTGLEAVLLRDPLLTPVRQYDNDGALRTWTLFLIDWTDSADLAAIGAYLLSAYPGTDVTPEPAAKGSGPRSRLRVAIRHAATTATPYTP